MCVCVCECVCVCVCVFIFVFVLFVFKLESYAALAGLELATKLGLTLWVWPVVCILSLAEGHIGLQSVLHVSHHMHNLRTACFPW